MKDRLQQIIDYYKITPTLFSKKIGVSEGTIRKLLTQNTTFRSDTLEKISQNFTNLNIDWLITGRGEMFRNTVSQSIDGNHNIQANGDVKIDDSTIKLKEKISYLESQVCFLTEQLKEKDNQINTLLSIMSNK